MKWRVEWIFKDDDDDDDGKNGFQLKILQYQIS